MTYNHREARRRAFAAVSETCPAVDAALTKAAEAIKADATNRLRDALVDAYAEVVRLEVECEELQAKVRDLERELSDARDELREKAA